MKYSAFYPIVVGLVLGAMLLPGTALAEKKTPFISTETDTPTPAGDRFMADGWGYLFDGKSTLVEDASDKRVNGTGWYSAYAMIDLQTGAATFWGKFHIDVDNESGKGSWEGYWTGNGAPDGLSATLVGSGDFEGLVSRWTSTSHGGGIVNWKGYIVENGPGYVPFKISGWRQEQGVPIFTDPNQPPPYAKAIFVAGGGQASHIGQYTDIMETGLMDLTTGKSRGMGSAIAANGDRFTWVSFGGPNAEGKFGFEVFFAGGTGRFEHAVGSYAGQISAPGAYTYEATGKIRY